MFHVPCGFVDLIFIPLNIYSVWLINNKMLLHVYRMRYDYSREANIRLITLSIYERRYPV